MDKKSTTAVTNGMQPRSRWVWLVVFASIASFLVWLVGSWALQAREIERAFGCGKPCLATHSAEVWKTDTVTHDSGDGIYNVSTTEHVAWVDLDTGQSVKVGNLESPVYTGDHVTVQMVGGRVVVFQDHQVWNGWGVEKFGVLLFLLPALAVSVVGVLAQAACLIAHYLRKRPSHQLETVSATTAGLLTGWLCGFALYLGMGAPWFWIHLSVMAAVVAGLFELLRYNLYNNSQA